MRRPRIGALKAISDSKSDESKSSRKLDSQAETQKAEHRKFSSSMKHELEVNKPEEQNNDSDSSDIITLPKLEGTNDGVGFSEFPIPGFETFNLANGEESYEFPILRITGDNSNQPCVPEGSAFVKTEVNIPPFPPKEIHLCIDTGANYTVCSNAFLMFHFGKHVVENIKWSGKLPRLKSATGHKLKVIGYVDTKMRMGTYEFEFQVLVYELKECIFLLGNDCFYDRFIYDSGKFISFKDSQHQPVEIEYFRSFRKAMINKTFYLAPNSGKALSVKVAKPLQLTGHAIIASPLAEQVDYRVTVEPTVSLIQPDGSALLWVSNHSDDVVQIPLNAEIADVHLVAEAHGVVLADESEEINLLTGSSWPEAAMEALKDKLPPSIALRPKQQLTNEANSAEKESLLKDKKLIQSPADNQTPDSGVLINQTKAEQLGLGLNHKMSCDFSNQAINEQVHSFTNRKPGLVNLKMMPDGVGQDHNLNVPRSSKSQVHKVSHAGMTDALRTMQPNFKYLYSEISDSHVKPNPKLVSTWGRGEPDFKHERRVRWAKELLPEKAVQEQACEKDNLNQDLRLGCRSELRPGRLCQVLKRSEKDKARSRFSPDKVNTLGSGQSANKEPVEWGPENIGKQSTVARALETRPGQASSAKARLSQPNQPKANSAKAEITDQLAKLPKTHSEAGIAKLISYQDLTNSVKIDPGTGKENSKSTEEIKLNSSPEIWDSEVSQPPELRTDDIQVVSTDKLDNQAKADEQHKLSSQAVDKLIEKFYANKYPSNQRLMRPIKGQLSRDPQNQAVINSAEMISYVHDRKEKRDLLDGTGEGFPTPSSHELSDLPSKFGSPEWTEKVDHSHLQESEWTKLHELILLNEASFAKHKGDIGCSNLFAMSLPLKPGTGYLYSKPRPTPAKHKELISEHITELLEQGIIRPSKSPFATNIVIVKKKSGVGEPPKTRMCVDLREVNEHSVPSRFPNHSLEDSLEKIQGAKFRSSFDFNQAFHQIVLQEESIPVTAFYANNILYEYTRLPFGHVTAMQGFCSLMALLCHDYPPASYYADDLMITTPNNPLKTREELFEQHLHDIEGMLKRIAKAGLKLSAHKCQWAYDSDRPMDWLGFTLECNLLKPQLSKIKAVKEFPTPKSAKQAISFVSLASFYRRFIKSFARIAQPIYEVSRHEHFKWTPEADRAFNELKEVMCSTLVLRLPRQGEPFTVYTDASWGACGAVLTQKDPVDGQLHPCAFGSRKFNDAELKMSTPCKELLAITYALNLWAFYLCGNQVHVLSDCKAWSFLKTQSGTSSKISRLALMIQEYDVTIGYIPGPKNKAADGLSRAFDDGTVKCDDVIANRHPALEFLTAPKLEEGKVLKLGEYLNICEDFLVSEIPRILTEHKAREIAEKSTKNLNIEPALSDELEGSDVGVLEDIPLTHRDRISHIEWQNSLNVANSAKTERSMVNSISDYQLEIEEAGDSDDQSEQSEASRSNGQVNLVALNHNVFSFEGFQELQAQDSFCCQKINGIKEKLDDVINAGYFIKRKILMRKISTKDGQQFEVVVIPVAIVKILLESTHNSFNRGHFGSEKYLLDMRSRYFWPSMKKDIVEFHKQCIPCQFNDKYPVKFEIGNIIKPTHPMSVIYLDLVVGLPRSTSGNYSLLLVYDGFSRFAQGVPLASEKAEYVARKFIGSFIAAFGPPIAIHSDNARNLDGSIMRHLCLMLGCAKSSNPSYNPQSNPCETICGAIVQLIRKALTGSDQRYWDLCLPFVLSAYNSTIHTMTGYTPNALFLGRTQERDLVPLVPFESESANISEYFQKVRRFQELAFDIVRKRNEDNVRAKKIQLDKNAIKPKFQVGDYVLVKNLAPGKGPGLVKLRSKYIGPFRIIKVYPSSLVLVPWSLSTKLDEFYKDPNVFRLAHRGDVKTFETRLVPIRHVKPYRGPVDKQEIIEPMLLKEFVDALELSSIPDLESQIDENWAFDGTDLSGASLDPSMGTSHSSNQGPGPGHWQPPPKPPPDPPPSDHFTASSGTGSTPNLGRFFDYAEQDLNLNHPDIIPPAGDNAQNQDNDLDGDGNFNFGPAGDVDDEENLEDNLDIGGGDLLDDLEGLEDLELENAEGLSNGSEHDNMDLNLDADLDEGANLGDDANLGEDKKSSTKSSTSSSLEEARRELDQAQAFGKTARSLRLKIDELEKLITNPDDDIRERAELELKITLDQLKLAKMKAGFKTPSASSSDKSPEFQPDVEKASSPAVSIGEALEETAKTEQFGSAVSEQDVLEQEGVAEDEPYQESVADSDLEDTAVGSPIAGPSQPQRFDITTPSFRLTIGPTAGVQIPPMASPRKKVTFSPPGAEARALDPEFKTREWVKQLPDPKVGKASAPPQFTSSGREIKKPVKLDPADESVRQKELREAAKKKDEGEKASTAKASSKSTSSKKTDKKTTSVQTESPKPN